MDKFEEIKIMGAEGYSISTLVYACPDAKASIQIIHGMAEFKGRYIDLATFFADNGYNVILPDLRGHGKDAPMLSHIADRKGRELLLKDQQIITGYIKDRFKDLPVYIFAHSMGSIIARVLLQTDSCRYSKVALSGYVCPVPISGVAVVLGYIVKVLKGPKSHSRLLTTLALGPYITSVKDRKTNCDWLTYNEDNVKCYIDHPLCGEEFTIGSYGALFGLLHKMGKAGAYRDVNKDIKLLLCGGKDDPCIGGDEGRAASKKILEDAGFGDIRVITYDHMRHEIINEDNKEKVYKDILEFFDLI